MATVAPLLARAGVEVTVVGGDPGRMVGLLGAGVAYIPAATTLAVVKAIRSRTDADLVHAHMTAAELAAAIATPRRSTIVTTRHFASPRGSGPFAKIVRTLIERRLSGELAISGHVARAAGATAEVLRSGVPDESVGAQTDKVVLVVQRLEPEKFTLDALAIWDRSHLADLGWKLTIVGDGSQRAAIETEVTRLGLGDSVELAGPVSSLGLVRAAASIALATTPNEGLGLAVIEAMAVGLPVVACSSGGHLETSGACTPELLYPLNDLDAAARIIRDLASNESRRRVLGLVGRAYQQRELSIGPHVEQLVEFYERVVGAR